MKARKKITISAAMKAEDADQLMGVMASESDYTHLLDYDVDVYDKESGLCIAKLVRYAIPGTIQQIAFDSFKHAVGDNSNRFTAALVDKVNEVTKSGKVSNTARVRFTGDVQTGVAGYFDRTPRFPNCRQTAFNKHHLDKFKHAYPIIKLVDQYYETLMPGHYKLQKAMVKRSSADFIIPGTAFSTVTINKNYQTAYHKDSGDFKQGFGNLVALRVGQFSGCNLVLPRWGIAFNIQNGDILLMDVHQVHGNTPMYRHDKDAVRLSLVMYYRENIIKCGTMAQELTRVQNRKAGDSL